MKLNKKQIKLLNHIYFLSIKKKNIMINKKDNKILSHLNSESSYDFKMEDILELLQDELLEMQNHYITPNIKIKRLHVSSQGMAFIKPNILRKGEQKKETDIKRRKKFERMSQIDHYVQERNSGFYMSFGLKRRGGKEICLKCRSINVPCTHDNDFKKMLSVKARPPKKNAHKQKWIHFLEEFAPEGLKFL